jgi:hypothetical protein
MGIAIAGADSAARCRTHHRKYVYQLYKYQGKAFLIINPFYRPFLFLFLIFISLKETTSNLLDNQLYDWNQQRNFGDQGAHKA